MDKTTARIEFQNMETKGEKLLEGPFNTLFSIWGDRGYWHESDFGLHGLRALTEFKDLLIPLNLSLNILAGYCDKEQLPVLHGLQVLRDLSAELSVFITEALDGKAFETLAIFESKFNEWKVLFETTPFREIDEALSKAEKKEIFLKKRAISKFTTPLYHGIKLEHLASLLTRSSLEVRTVHRYWRDGLRRFDDHREENYNNCEWIKGISMTRDFDYAARWGEVVLVLNWNELKKNLTFIPVAWFKIHPKREREEFLYFKNEKETYKPDPETGRMSRDQLEKLKESVGEINLTEENFYGFYIRNSSYYSDKDWETLTRHPKFLGMYSA